MAKRWYVVHAYSGFEHQVKRALIDRIARAGMDAVMNGDRGTAGKSRIVAPEWRMAGKTGTSQVRNITAAERARGVISNDQLPWERRDHALFVCYAPVEAPRYAVSVVVEHGGGGSAVAAPVARDILLFALAGGLPPLDAAYFREDLLEERGPMMQQWGDFITGEVGISSIAEAVSALDA